ncbi:MAG: translation initiation factor IF-2, partial [Alphaproteobacteria bacterium]|nr:translation initiation factor IF-2 [Alphaproteobacteria bacterium]
ELLQHEIVAEEMGGDIQTVDVSAMAKTNLDKLDEAILLQAEILELKANPDRMAEGVIVEAKLDRGRGPVATVLVRRGTLNVGDIFVAGSEWGRARALIDSHGNNVDSAGPSVPVEILGLGGTPQAGDHFTVVENEARAREVAEYRQDADRDQRTQTTGPGSLQQMFERIQAGEVQEVPVVIKADVQGSLEAIVGALEKMSTDEVAVRVLHGGVGGITESDITLANASDAMVIGFNVRANAQAREMSNRDKVEIQYYQVIYELVDDVKAALSGLLAPERREEIIGTADILEVFSITKAGRVAGCRVSSGLVRRNARVRLLRDDIVIHDGALKSLKRFKDDVREVREGNECGIALESYQDVQSGDVLEFYEVEEIERSL